jgi:hypothetical protein
MAGTLTEEDVVRALRAMALLKADDAPKVEPLSDHDQWQTYKVITADGHPLLVRTSDKGRCAAAHFYATTAVQHVPDLRPKVLGHDAERGILVEEWLDPHEFKSLAQELLHEKTRHGWSTPFRPDEFSEVDFKNLLQHMGGMIEKIHAGTGFVQFRNVAKAATRANPSDIFLLVANAHPHLASHLREIVEQSVGVEPVMLHGCLSPNSVLFSEEDVIAIISPDRIASGDPALDLAHMMAHLFIASVHRGTSIFVEMAGEFSAGYVWAIKPLDPSIIYRGDPHAYAESLEALDKLPIMYRAGPLSVAFMLALLEDEQISSVLDARDKEDILEFSQWWLDRRDYTLGQVRYALWEAVEGAIDWREEFESLPRARN